MICAENTHANRGVQNAEAKDRLRRQAVTPLCDISKGLGESLLRPPPPRRRLARLHAGLYHGYGAW